MIMKPIAIKGSPHLDEYRLKKKEEKENAAA